MGFVTNGSEKFRINTSGQLLNSNSSSSASTPDYSWNNNVTTGIFHPASNTIGFTIGGVEAMKIYNNKKLFIGTQPNSSSPWLDGQLTIANPTVNERCLVLNHTANTDWQSSMTTNVNNANSTSYGVSLNGTGTFYVAGSGWVYYSQGSYLGSDFNIKDDISIIDSASAKINKIKGVTYKLKKEKQNPSLYGLRTANEYMGVIAQDVEKVAPQAVKTIHDGTKAVSYEMLIGLLIEGFKEQSAKLEQLEVNLSKCCAKNSDLNITNRLANTTPNNTVNVTEDDTKSYLKQNKPNPFNKETLIEYNIIESGVASILVFDMNGKLLKTIPVKIPG